MRQWQGENKIKRRKHVGPVPPGPNDLTEEKILKRNGTDSDFSGVHQARLLHITMK